MNKDIINVLFEDGSDLYDACGFSITVNNATLREEFRGTTFHDNFHGCFEVSFDSMVLRKYDDEGFITHVAPIKISIDHTCTNPPTA